MVTASTGVRLVKCPKCLNLLPELPNVPVYRCGGCGAVLRAKIRATSGESASSESTQKVSIEISEKELTISDSKNSLLNENSEKLEKIGTDEPTKPVSESTSTGNLNSNDSSEMEAPVVTETELKEEIAKASENKEKPSEENHASESLNMINSDLNEISEMHKGHIRKDTDSSVSEEFHSALNFTVPEKAPKDAVIYRKPPRNLHNGELTKTNSYEVLQADILSRVDKLRHELVELFGKPHEEIGNYSHARPESSRYRRVRINLNQNMSNSKPHHNLNFHKIEAHKIDKRPQIVTKNLCRPILIGAPFVICSDCFKLIQLPADFSLETKRLRKLQCGNCNKILLYSYRPQPYHPTPLSSTGTETGTGTGAGTTPYMDPFHRADPMSISEEYGLSFNISYSTEPDQHEPLHVSRNSSFSTNEGLNSKSVVRSRLHQIMGYESASEILLRRVSDVSMRNNEDYERERKGKGIIVDEYNEMEGSKDRMKGIYGQDSPRRSRIHGLFKKGVSKLKA